MKKIIALIIVVCSISIGLFIWYMSTGIDTREVYYDTVATYKDITYKSLSDETLEFDILMPTTDVYEEIPVIFYVHGGGFISGDKTDLTEGLRKYVVEDVLDEGYAIISLNYRLLDEDTHFPANLTDVNDAIKYATSIAGYYDFDVDNYGIWGVEAGAYLALTIAYSEDGFFGGDSTLNEYSADIKYVIDYSGLTDYLAYKDIDNLNTTELVDVQAELDIFYSFDLNVYELTGDEEYIRNYDPLTYISDDTVDTYVLHGKLDDVVTIEQARLLKNKLDEYSLTYTYKEQVGGNSDLSELPEEERNILVAEFITFITENYISD